MAKETKLDRLVRLMFDNMSEHVHEIKALEANPGCKELDVERWCQSVLRSCLGFSATNGYSIRAQEQKGKHRPDLVVYKGEKPIFVFEVKKLGFDLNKSDLRSGRFQLQDYLYSLGNVPYGFLCNGYEWRLYDFSSPTGIVEIMSLDIRNDEDKLDASKKWIEDLCYEFVNFHESAHANGKDWPELLKEATAFSPESLSKAILSSNTIKNICKEIRGEHEYKASIDALYHKVFDLLSNGLDDCLKEQFNDEKKAEFQKYIKAQMKNVKKVKRSVAKSQAQTSESPNTTTVVLKSEIESAETSKKDEAA